MRDVRDHQMDEFGCERDLVKLLDPEHMYINPGAI